jgi:hypothetical protein
MGLRQAIKKTGLADICVFGGLALLGTGLWWFRPWISLTVTGALFFLMGLWASVGAKK